jgi:aspartokinase/homoserine dehydrogenase 1
MDWEHWRSEYLEGGVPLDLEAFGQHIRAAHLPHAMIIDCSASAEVASHYAAWLEAGIHIVTPNKQAGSAPLAQYDAIRAAAKRGHWRYEATVGAGLPVISTLRDLLDTGDELIAVEGIFSGTLSYLFNNFDGSKPFSKLVLEARAAGFTEPDPRDDLSGMDVARKLVILAREAGRRIELADVALESLVPEALMALSREDFLARADELDATLSERIEGARGRGCVLRFVAELSEQGASVGLVELPSTHAFAHLRPTDNVVQFTTARYRDNPLVVQGPGAGPDVTAAGVFADLLRVSAALGARL